MCFRKSTLVTLAFIVQQSFAQGNFGVEYLGNWNGRSTPSGAYSPYSACWGYSAPNGREYALLGSTLGTSIIDITDAPTLTEVGFVSGPSSNWREMKTYQQYAYVVSDQGGVAQGNGVQIINLNNPSSPTLVTTYVWTDTIQGPPLSQVQVPLTHTVSIEGKYLYLNGGGGYTGIRILDLSNPISPLKAGKYSGPYFHDSFVRNDTIFGSAIYAGGGVDIVDARNKTTPTRIKFLQYPGSGTHNAWTTQDGRALLTTDEIGSTPKTLKFWSIADLQSPMKIAEVAAVNGSDTAIVHNVVVKGNLAYVAWYTAGARVIDVSNPANPTVVGSYDTYPANDSAQYAGVWGIFPFFSSGKFVVSDMQTGLHVMRYPVTPTKVENGISNPRTYALHQNYPNPFNPRTTIVFEIPKETEAQLTLYNLFGQEIRILAQGRFSPGSHSIQVDASTLPSGVYFYTIKTPEFKATRRMVLVK